MGIEAPAGLLCLHVLLLEGAKRGPYQGARAHNGTGHCRPLSGHPPGTFGVLTVSGELFRWPVGPSLHSQLTLHSPRNFQNLGPFLPDSMLPHWEVISIMVRNLYFNILL